MTTNYEDRVPESLRRHTAEAFERAVEDRRVHPDAEPFVQSLVLAAYAWQHPAYQPEWIEVLIPGLNAEPGVSWSARRVDEPAAPRMLYRINGDPNGVAVGRFKAGLRKYLGIGGA